MRIVLVTSGIRGIGSYCLNLYNYLSQQGHEVLLVSESKWKKQRVENLYEARSFMLLGLAPIVYKPKELIKAIKTFRPDIIHYHWPCGTFDILFGRLKKLGVPILVTLHVAVASKKALFDKFWYYYFGMFKKHLHDVEGVNSISMFVQNQLRTRINLPETKHLLQYAGINEEVFKPVKRDEDDTIIRLLFVGQIMPEKGIDKLINAVKRVSRHRDIHLGIIGEGHLKKYLVRKTKGHKYIEWIGFLGEQRDIARYYANVDLTVLPTRWDEAFSLVPVESMACGTPVKATRKGGTPEIIIPGQTGYLLEDCNEEELFNSLLFLKKSDLIAMRPHCRKLIEERHTFKIMGSGHEEWYRKTIKEFSCK